MKNILKTTIFAFLLVSFVSCTNDKESVAVLNGFELRDVSESAPPTVLLEENESQTFIDLDWNADYGVPTGNTGTTGLTYKFIITDRDKPTVSVESEVSFTRRDSTLTVKQFNVLLNSLSTFIKCTPMNVEIRVESTLGNVTGNQLIQKSSPIFLTVTGYSSLPKTLAFVKEGSLPVNAPKVISSSSQNINDFEGYMYLEAGDYKFYQANSCDEYTGELVYGGIPNDETKEINGDGTVVAGVDAPSINIATAGYYFVTADLTPGGLKYTTQIYKTFGVFGTAVKSTSASVVPMAGDNTNIWTITIDLFKGRLFRFRSNDWTGELIGSEPKNIPPGTSKLVTTLGLAGSSLTNVTGTDGGIKVPGTDDKTKQKYKITLDVSKPRAYTYKLELVE
jgi:hypothetical protein